MSNDPSFNQPVVLVVDDAPDSLGFLCEALSQAGYLVLIANDGSSALARLELVVPDAILLDAVMPGLSGFETCRLIREEPGLTHVPIIFMTGLSGTAEVVQGFTAGGTDYVVKPLRVEEVLARLSAHVRNARAVRIARQAVDVAGLGVLVIDALGRIAWRSPRAAESLAQFGIDTSDAPPREWLVQAAGFSHQVGTDATLVGEMGEQSLYARSLGAVGLGEHMLLLDVRHRGESSTRIAGAQLTPREAEVLSWLAKGKTNRDIGDILGMSPRTVNKHLEHVYEKLGVETRAAAAALAMRAESD
ncbi:MAG: response regulator [Methyloversatilis sp.]|nr:response regulator [Methyloversatilis sp.]MBP6195043.1 response regulator [Methyloversatilis sp.]MBP9118384.1 response regulator [Methyloversatilis sp.]